MPPADLYHVAQATRATRIAHLARAAFSADVVADPLDRRGRSSRLEFQSDRRFGFPEAITDQSIAEREFLPDGDTLRDYLSQCERALGRATDEDCPVVRELSDDRS